MSKPGSKTTEFWLTVVNKLIGVLLILVGIGTIGTVDETLKGEILLAGAGLIGATGIGYSLSRGRAKGGNGKT